MNDNTNPEDGGTNSAVYSLILTCIIFAVVYSAYQYLRPEGWGADTSKQDDTGSSIEIDAAPVATQAGSVPVNTPSAATTQKSQEIAAARRRAELRTIGSIIEAIDYQLSSADTLITNWNDEFQPLLKNDRGRQIATDDTAVRQLTPLFHGDYPSSAELENWRQELDIAAAPLRKSTNTDTIILTDQDKEFFYELQTRVEAAVDRLEKRERSLRFLLSSTAKLEASDSTLEQRMAEVENDAIKQFMDAAAEKRMQALKKKVEEESKAIQAAEEKRIAAEAQKKIAEQQAKEAQLLMEQEKLNEKKHVAMAEAARQKLEAEFQRDQAEIKSLLSPFTSDGDAHPTIGNDDSPQTWIYRTGYGPVSFGRLQSSGCLEATREGRQRLYFFGGTGDNLRPKRGFPAYSRTGLNSQATVARVDRARELLLKYGDLMVEKGMLAR